MYKIQVFSAEVCNHVTVILEQKYQSDSLTKVTEVVHAQMLCQYWRWSQRRDETVTMQVCNMQKREIGVSDSSVARFFWGGPYN